MAIIPSAISRVIVPHLSALQAKNTHFHVIYKEYIKTQVYTLLMALLILLPGWWLIDPVIHHILPSYESGIPAARIMMIAALPFLLIDNASNVLMALERKRDYLINMSISLALMILSLGALTYWKYLNAITVSSVCLFIFTLYALLNNMKIFTIRTQLKTTKA